MSSASCASSSRPARSTASSHGPRIWMPDSPPIASCTIPIWCRRASHPSYRRPSHPPRMARLPPERRSLRPGMRPRWPRRCWFQHRRRVVVPARPPTPSTALGQSRRPSAPQPAWWCPRLTLLVRRRRRRRPTSRWRDASPPRWTPTSRAPVQRSATRHQRASAPLNPLSPQPGWSAAPAPKRRLRIPPGRSPATPSNRSWPATTRTFPTRPCSPGLPTRNALGQST